MERILGRDDDLDGAATGVRLKSGAVLPADVVVVGVGARPVVHPFEALAQAPSPPGGIAVDGALRARGPGVAPGSVFAVGDVACFPLRLFGGRAERVEHVDHARQSAAHVAKLLLTCSKEERAAEAADKLPAYDYLCVSQHPHTLQRRARARQLTPRSATPQAVLLLTRLRGGANAPGGAAAARIVTSASSRRRSRAQEGSPRPARWVFYGDNAGEALVVGDFAPQLAAFWLDAPDDGGSATLCGVFLESGPPDAVSQLPALARRRPRVDAQKLRRARSVAEALAAVGVHA